MQRHFICQFTPYGREPVLRRMRDGTLICLFLSGGKREPSNENNVYICRSADDGATWTAPEVLFSHSHRGVWASELFTEGDIPCIFVHTYNAESWYRELQTFRSFSYDNGKTWTSPVSLPGGLTGISVRQGIAMSNGEWIFPIYWQPVKAGAFDWAQNVLEIPPSFRSGVIISSDQGSTFRRFGDLYNDDIALWEPSCVELEEGHILMVMRGLRYLFVSESYDYGRTWSPAKESSIPCANTKPLLLRVRNTILLINNFVPRTAFDARTHLEVWVSHDMMRSWTKQLPLMPTEEKWFYPHAFADEATQTVYIACENMTRHELLKLSFDELDIR